MFVGVLALRYQHHTKCCVVLITECHNSHKHSQNPLTMTKAKDWLFWIPIPTCWYKAKCSDILNNGKFTGCDANPIISLETNIQHLVRNIKKHLSAREYQTIYSTGSRNGEFYETAKVHKLNNAETASNLTLRPIISNIGTASYHLAKYKSYLHFRIRIHSAIHRQLYQHNKIPANSTNNTQISFDVVLQLTN